MSPPQPAPDEHPNAGSTVSEVRDAATVILWRSGDDGAEVLMGTRGAQAVFLPNKVVFPGGAVDPGDAKVPLAGLPPDPCFTRLSRSPRPGTRSPARALLAAAIRELWEETGLVLGRPEPDPQNVAPDWEEFAATGHSPDASALRFVFRAVTPPGRSRRFDARFFLVPAAALRGPADDFARASGELSYLQWVPIADARRFDLPFITEVALAEVAPLIAGGGQPSPDGVPYVENDDVVSRVTRLI